MRFTKIFGACLIMLGIGLLTLQIAWLVSPQAGTERSRNKAVHDSRRSPYPGIAGVALVVGGIGFLFTARRRDEPEPRRLRR